VQRAIALSAADSPRECAIAPIRASSRPSREGADRLLSIGDHRRTLQLVFSANRLLHLRCVRDPLPHRRGSEGLLASTRSLEDRQGRSHLRGCGNRHGSRERRISPRPRL
jgi:hypothetical protein